MNILFETKYALRRLKNSPSYTAISLVVISLSVALSVVILALVYSFTWKPLGFPDMHGWQAVRGFTPNGWRGGFTDSSILWGMQQGDLHSVEIVGAYEDLSLLLDDGQATYSLSSRFITPNILQHSNETPVFGRMLSSDDAKFGATPAVLLSYKAWRQYYNADSNVVGSQTRIGGQLRTIVGVLKEDSQLIHGAFWLPITDAQLQSTNPDGHLQSLVKIRNEVSLPQATAELNQVVQRLKTEFPGRISDSVEWRLMSLNNLLFQTGEPIFLSLATAAPLILLLACLSIGTLLFARILEQRIQLAIRNAVGSSPFQSSSQASVESLLLCLGGCALGLLMAVFAILNINSLMDGYWSNHIQGAENPNRLQFNSLFVWLALVEAAGIWLASGLIPAIRASKLDISATLGGGSKGIANTQSQRTTTALIGIQVILGCFLLIVSGTYAYRNVYQTYLDRGVSTTGLSTASVAVAAEYPTQQDRINYLNELTLALNSISKVSELTITSALPDNYSPPVTVTFDQGEQVASDQGSNNVITHISDNYFSTVGLKLIEGRRFDDQDNQSALPVVIVDEKFARRYWPDDYAVGKRVHLSSFFGNQWATIVGVSAHTRRNVADNLLTLYRPLQQQVPNELLLLFKHQQPLHSIQRELASAASGINRDVPLTNVLSIEAYQLATWGWRMVQSNIFAWTYSVTLLLVALSIFAVLSRTIVQRVRDIGVRRALGSSNQKIMALYIRRGFLFVLFGCAIGTGLALIASDWLMNFRAGDFPNFIAHVSVVVVSTLAIFIFVATYFPARKAVSLEPGDALRYE